MIRFPSIALLVILITVSCIGETVPGLEKRKESQKTIRALMQITSGLFTGICVIGDAVENRQDAEKSIRSYPDDFLSEEDKKDMKDDVDSWRPIHTAGLITAGGFIVSGALTFPIRHRRSKGSRQASRENDTKKTIIIGASVIGVGVTFISVMSSINKN